jgi:hypothetical protein
MAPSYIPVKVYFLDLHEVRTPCYAIRLYSDGEIPRLVMWTTIPHSRLMLPPLRGSLQAEHGNDIVPPSTCKFYMYQLKVTWIRYILKYPTT